MASPPPPAALATSPRPRRTPGGTGGGSGGGRGSLDEPRRSVQTNRNAEWMSQTVAWAFLTGILLLTWLAAAAALGDAPGPAWTAVHLAHASVSFYLLHWAKGSPVPADQGKYDSLTFWEQLDDGVQNTGTRKFLTVLPVATFVLASHGTAWERQPLALNALALILCLVPKLPAMHRVRLFGINRW